MQIVIQLCFKANKALLFIYNTFKPLGSYTYCWSKEIHGRTIGGSQVALTVIPSCLMQRVGHLKRHIIVLDQIRTLDKVGLDAFREVLAFSTRFVIYMVLHLLLGAMRYRHP